MNLSDADRAKRRELMLERKAWLKSTGPRTPEGKRRSSMNAFKDGSCSRNPKLREQARRIQQELEEAQLKWDVFTALARSGMFSSGITSVQHDQEQRQDEPGWIEMESELTARS